MIAPLRLVGIVGLAVWSAVATASRGDEGIVTKVADGDTVRMRLDGREVTVRLIGVDTPELGEREDPAAPPQPFATEAAAFTRQSLAGQRVRLEYDPRERRDKYGRTLAYVFLDDGTLFNRRLLQGGYARVYARFPFRYREQFLADEAAARDAKRGLWGLGEPLGGPVIGNRRSRLYHLPGQRHYGAVAADNRVYFDSEEAARAAGYAPARR
jgi:micrococcal nuclease